MFIGAFCGEEPTLAQLNNASYGDLADSPTDAFQAVQFNSNGEVQDNGTADYDWMLAGAASDFEVYVHKASGDTLSAGTLDTWLSLGSTRTYSLTEQGIGSKEAVLEVQIRDAVNQTVRATATITLTVQVEFGGGG